MPSITPILATSSLPATQSPVLDTNALSPPPPPQSEHQTNNLAPNNALLFSAGVSNAGSTPKAATISAENFGFNFDLSIDDQLELAPAAASQSRVYIDTPMNMEIMQIIDKVSNSPVVSKPDFQYFKNRLTKFIEIIQSKPDLIQNILVNQLKGDAISADQLKVICETINCFDLEKSFMHGDRVLRSLRVDKRFLSFGRTLDLYISNGQLYIVIMKNSKNSHGAKIPKSERVVAVGGAKVYKPEAIIDLYTDFEININHAIGQIARKRMDFDEISSTPTLKNLMDIQKLRYDAFEEVNIANSINSPYVANLIASEEFYRMKKQKMYRSIYLYARNGIGALYTSSESKRGYASIEDFCKNHNQELDRVIYQVIEQMMLGIKAFHDQNIGHFDIKLANFIVFEEVDNVTGRAIIRIKLDDFGASIDKTRAQDIQRRFLNHLGFSGNPTIKNRFMLEITYMLKMLSMCPQPYIEHPDLATQKDAQVSISAIKSRVEILLQKQGYSPDLYNKYSRPYVQIPATSEGFASPQVYYAHLETCRDHNYRNYIRYYENYLNSVGGTLYKQSHNDPYVAHCYSHDILGLENDIFALGVTMLCILQECARIPKDIVQQLFTGQLCLLDPSKRPTIDQALSSWRNDADKFFHHAAAGIANHERSKRQRLTT